VDSETPETIVIIHLYQSHIATCIRLNDILQRLSQKYPTYKFGKIISTEAKPGFDDKALPSLLVYKGGEVLSSFVRLQDDLNDDFDFDDVDEFFSQNGIVHPSHAAPDWE